MSRLYLQSKAELLAMNLRERIARGELSSPLLSVRDWSTQLGVSHGTLEKAVRILKRDGLLGTRPRRGIEILRRGTPQPSAQQPPVVRWIHQAGRTRVGILPTLSGLATALTQNLLPHEIRLSLEVCDRSRLRGIYRQGEQPHQLLMLASLAEENQRLFRSFRRSALLVGLPFPGIDLPYVSIDVVSAVRHAAFRLVRRGFERVSLVVIESSRQQLGEDLRRICAAAPRPLEGDIVRLPVDLYEQQAAAQRLAARLQPGHGLLAVSPVAAGLLMMAVTRRGLRVPGAVEVIAINAMPYELRTSPLPVHYPYPVDRLVRSLRRAALHYFDQGSLPPLRQLLPLQLVVPPPD